jgi:signal transduction histidine kinase
MLLMDITVQAQQVSAVSPPASKSSRLIIDSIKKRLLHVKEDTAAVNCLNGLADKYCNYSYDSSLFYSEKAKELAIRSGFTRGLVTAILRRGYAEEVVKKNWDTAVVYYRKAIETARQNQLDDMLDPLYSIIHNAYVYQGNFPLAMTTAHEGLEAAKKRGDKKQMLHYTSLVAASYFRQGLYDKALAEYKMAETIAANLGNDERASLNLVNLADIYYGLGEIYTAKGDSTMALHFLQMAFSKFSELEKDSFFIRHYMISNTLFKLGMVYRMAGNPPKALVYARMALDSCVKFSCNPYEKTGYYLLAGDALRKMGRFSEAEPYLYTAKAIAEEIKHAENARDTYYHLSLFFADKKKYDSAWYYNQRYVVLKDSIINERTRFRTEEINVIYGIAEKDRKIARQNNQRNILIASFILLLLTLGFLYNRHRLRQRNRYQKELNLQQNELFNAVSLAQEQERKRIAQDLHDSLGSVLSAAKLKMAEVKDNRPELVADEKFLSGIGLLDEASSELRNISHNIMPATLSKLGLVPALKNLTEKISSHKGVHVLFFAHDFDHRINEQTEISVYRIILELINNVVKHAQATKATVQLVKYPDYINITVEDNGKGFDITKATDEKTGIGLGSVAARVEYLKGKMDIDSRKGTGTTVVVDIPVN